jgi:hypothetical protein
MPLDPSSMQFESLTIPATPKLLYLITGIADAETVAYYVEMISLQYFCI